jgi:GT2 family glycosyltransferase
MRSDANTELAGHSGSLVSISIVSHRHGELLPGLFKDIERFCKDVEVLLTLNVPEDLPLAGKDFRFPLRILRNAAPTGFGANHNAAFRQASGSHFCVLNPDIRLDANPFPALIDALARDQAGVVAPKIVNSQGQVENNARRFPTLSVVLRKALTGTQPHDYDIAGEPLHPDWVAGMFMLFRSEVFRGIGGFDERYFLYYEDVDLCLRLRRRGHAAMLEPRVVARHDARRASHRDARHLLWHARSLARFLCQRAVGRD